VELVEVDLRRGIAEEQSTREETFLSGQAGSVNSFLHFETISQLS
jgi:hypothetical protein